MKFFMKFLIRSLSVFLVFSALNSCKFGGTSSSYGDGSTRPNPAQPSPSPQIVAEKALKEFMDSLYFVDENENRLDLTKEITQKNIWVRGKNQDLITGLVLAVTPKSAENDKIIKKTSILGFKVSRPKKGTGALSLNLNAFIIKSGRYVSKIKVIPFPLLEEKFSKAEEIARFNEELADLKILEFEDGSTFTPDNVHSNFRLPKTGKYGSPVEWHLPAYGCTSLKDRGNGVYEVLAYDDDGQPDKHSRNGFKNVKLSVSINPIEPIDKPYLSRKIKYYPIVVTKKTENQKTRDELHAAAENIETFLVGLQPNKGLDLQKVDRDIFLPKETLSGIKLKWKPLSVYFNNSVKLTEDWCVIDFLKIHDDSIKLDHTFVVTLRKGESKLTKRIAIKLIDKFKDKEKYSEFVANVDFLKEEGLKYRLSYLDGKALWPGDMNFSNCDFQGRFASYLSRDLALPNFLPGDVNITWSKSNHRSTPLIIKEGRGIPQRHDSKDVSLSLTAYLSKGKGASKASTTREFMLTVPKKDRGSPSTSELDDQIENEEILKSIVKLLNELMERNLSEEEKYQVEDTLDALEIGDGIFKQVTYQNSLNHYKDLYPRTRAQVDSSITQGFNGETEIYALVLFYSHYQDVYEKKHGKKSPDFDAEIYHQYDYRKNEFP